MKKLTILIIVMLLLLTTDYGLLTANAAVPHLLNYQGRLTDVNGKPFSDGIHSITFRIFDAETAGNMLWQGAYSVTTQKGIFNVLLGDISDTGYNFSNLAFDRPYFLEIKVEAEVMSPRQRITSAGYALRAEDTEKLAGRLPADYALASDIAATPTANKAVRLDTNAKLPATALKVYDSGWFAVVSGTKYSKTHNLGTNKLLIKIFFSTFSNGANAMCDDKGAFENGVNRGSTIKNITSTTFDLQTGANIVWNSYNDVGGIFDYASGFMRIIMLALE